MGQVQVRRFLASLGMTAAMGAMAAAMGAMTAAMGAMTVAIGAMTEVGAHKFLK
jgi:uncharacterized RmlC-like cupin family protein